MSSQENNFVEVDESFEGVLQEEQVPTEAVAVADEELDCVGHEESEYQQLQTERKIAPVIKEAIKYQEDKLKAEVNEVLQDEVGYRLDKYEKRRRRRDIKDRLGVALKWIVIMGIIAFIYGTPQLRIKFAVLFRDFGDLVIGLVNNEEVSSNQLVEDALSDLGVDLNESSGVEDEESPST